ncbi:MAG TPA: serine/threonine-protein kinase [Planosporangium sp.]|nr:serine/threonine-protein kinase [Planosporangium sp.]
MKSETATAGTPTLRTGRVLTPEGTIEDRSYELLEEIGSGATATVWRGRDRASGREVAVKVLHEEHVGHPKAVARFLQERSILLALRHDNIVRVRDLIATGDGMLALVMDLVHGGNLRDYLAQRGTLPTAEAAELLAQVADGLNAAHVGSVVHRDLKPDNVLVDRALDGSPRARLTDFGIARVLDAPGMTTSGAVVGTPNYMAPELIEGGLPGPAVDVYALGMMFYELLVGRPAYADQLQSTILVRHLRGARRQRAGIPKQAWTLIQACLERDPARRPSAAALAVDLRRIALETAGVASLPRLADDVGRVASRPRRAVVSGMLVAVAVVASALAGFGGRQLIGGYLEVESGHAAPRTSAPLAGSHPGASPTASAQPTATPPASPEPVRSRSGLPGGVGGSAAVKVPPLPEVFNSWHCSTGIAYSYNQGALVRPCYATGPAVRVKGSIIGGKSGAKVDLTVALRDADTDAEAAPPHTCAGLMPTQMAPEAGCGPFDAQPPRGHRYVVVVSWKYTSPMPVAGGSTRGDAFTW